MLRRFADLLEECASLDPSLEKTLPEKVEQVYEQLDIIVPFLKQQLTNITNGDMIDRDAVYHSFFTKFFVPVGGKDGFPVRYIDDNKFEELMEQLDNLRR